jgi:hypothetical protein
MRLLACFSPKLTDLLSQIILSLARKVPPNSDLAGLVSNKCCVFLAIVVAYGHINCFPGRWPWNTTGHVQRPEFVPGSVHVRFVVAKSSTGRGFSPITSVVSPDNTIPPMLHIQLHLQAALTRTNAGNLGNRGAVDSKQFTFLLAFMQTPRS